MGGPEEDLSARRRPPFGRETGPVSGYLKGVHVAHLRLKDFRNYHRLEVDWTPGFHLLLGRNAQGKTNLLEAIYLVATLRSFRGATGAQMIRRGAPAYFIQARVLAEAESEVRLYWSPKERRLTLNREPVRRLGDYLGVLRAVVFCSEDALLVKGPPSQRRRFLNLLLAQTESSYLGLLQRYGRALRARNALLKQRPVDLAALEGFSREVVRLGEEIIRRRRALVPRVAPLVTAAYRRIAGEAEPIEIEYRPAVRGDFAAELARARERELQQRVTLVGPHRDDLALLLDGQPAGQFGSEGQKRSVAIALKMAQAELLTEVHGVPPVLLIDDVMGELDAGRRAGLLPLLERSHRARGQVFMTCTEESWPVELGRRLKRWEVANGTLRPLD